MHFTKQIHSIILCIVLMLLTCFMSTPAIAEQLPEYGVIAYSDNGVRVRAEPGNFNTDVGGLATGRRVRLLDVVTINNSQHPKWYKLQSVDFPEIIGYVSAKYVQPDEILPEYSPDADFEAYLTAQKFPESYKPMLRQLHTAYPKWVFIADHLEMSWDTAVTEESRVGRSLIERSVPDSWKSMEYGAYDYNTKDWIGLDGYTWVAASKGTVAYFLDPRNFLNSRDIFQFFMQTYIPSLQNLAGLKKMVSGTFLANSFPESGYATYADVIMEAAKQSGVSPYIIASMILTEQGTNGQGNSISGTVTNFKGLYNFFNVGASPSSGPYSDSVLNGLHWAKGGSENSTKYMRPWNSRTKAIIGGAKWYFDEYVNPNTSGGYTLYYKKFDVKKSPYYTFQYMTNIRGAYTEGSKLKSAYTDAELQNALEFRIPVYKNMPDTLAPEPGTTGSNDNYLSSLSVSDHPFSQEFSKFTTTYELIVDNNVSSVKINATPNNSGATVTGTGTKTLNVGSNVFTITVTSTSGQKRNYTISITREEANTSTDSPVIETTTYKIGSYVTGVSTDSSVSSFITNLKVKNGTAKLYNSSGANKTTGIVCTGDVVKIYDKNDALINSYNVVIYGDVNGDGKINAIDISRIQKHILNISTISNNVILEACDVSDDSRVNAIDISRIQKHILNISLIKQ